MAIRVKYTIELSLSESTADAKELGQSPPWKGTNDLQDDGGTWRRRIPASTADVEIDINGLANAHLVAIKSNKEITVKKNAATGEPWTVRPLGSSAAPDGIFVVTTDAVTKLYVSNPGAEDAEVTFSVAGIF